MQKVIIGLAVGVVLVIVVVVVAISNVNTYLEENREMLAGLASDAVGREVSFDAAEVAFSNGLAIRVAGLRVAEDPRFGQPDFLSLDEAYVGVRILPALRRRIEVSGIRLDAPTIRVIQTVEGFNFSSLGGTGEPVPVEPASAPPTSPEEAGAPLAVVIAVLEIVGGTIYYEDRTSPEGLSLVIEDIETSGTDLALDGPIAIDFSGRVRSAKAADAGLESRFEGAVRLESLETMVGTVRLTSPSLLPAIFGVRLEEEGELTRIDSLEVEARLSADPSRSGYPIRVRTEQVRLAGFDLDSIAIDVIYRDTPAGAELEIDPVTVGLAGGRVDLYGNVVLGEPGRSPFDLSMKIRDLDSGKLAEVVLGLPAGMLSGMLRGDITLQGDSLEWESLKRSLTGRLDLEIGEGAIEQVNVLNALVDRLVADPGLGQLAANAIRDVAPEALRGDRTPFEGIEMMLEIADGAIHAEELSIKADDFSIQAEGLLGLDGAISGTGDLRFSKELSQKILARADGFGSVLADGDTVSLPIRLGGTTDAPSLVPDFAALSGRATADAKQELANRASKGLADLIFGKKREDGDPESESERDTAEDRIREGLGRFLGLDP